MYNAYCIVFGANGSFQFTGGGYNSWPGGPIGAFTSGCNGSETQQLKVWALGFLNLSQVGTPLSMYIGFGTSSDEMLQAGRYSLVYQI